jgi:hypothetical protein
VWYFVDLDRENEMPDEPPSTSINRELTANIVAAYIRKNQIASDQLGMLISTVHQVLVGLGRPAAEIETERTPAVTIRQSVHRDYVTNIVLAGTCRVSIRSQRPAIRNSGLVWRNRSALGVDGGAGLPAKNQSPSHPEFRQRNNRDLDGEVGRDQGLLRACSAYPPTSGAPRCP